MTARHEEAGNQRPASLGFNSRADRLKQDHSGAWGTSSQDFLRLAGLLYEDSRRYADQVDGNCSPYALAGIPTLFGALRCLLIEVNDGVLTDLVPRRDALAALAASRNEVSFLLERYTVPEPLADDLQLLLEVRNEIIHPAHRPGPEQDNTPDYLRSLKARRLLQSTGVESDYIWLGQLQSHRLFQWAFQALEQVVMVVLDEHGVVDHIPELGWRESWSRYRATDAF